MLRAIALLDGILACRTIVPGAVGRHVLVAQLGGALGFVIQELILKMGSGKA